MLPSPKFEPKFATYVPSSFGSQKVGGGDGGRSLGLNATLTPRLTGSLGVTKIQVNTQCINQSGVGSGGLPPPLLSTRLIRCK